MIVCENFYEVLLYSDVYMLLCLYVWFLVMVMGFVFCK